MLNGHEDGVISDGWRSKAVRKALDLCLACKGCKTDCPANVDMATYKAEFLSHYYAGRLRPRADYALGYLPVLARVVSRLGAAKQVNRLAATPGLHAIAMRLAGLENREVPKFAATSLQQWWAGHRPEGPGDRGEVLLFPDTFGNYLTPGVGQAAVQVLESAGWNVKIPSEPLCCGLTWISTGQLRKAKSVLRHTVDVLAPQVRAGGLVLGLEPSCTAVFRSDAMELFPDNQDVHRLKDKTVTLAELLLHHTPGWDPPAVGHPLSAIAQVHCHQHAVMGWDTDAALLERIGVEAEHLESGCCGLAGNFGFTAGHGEVSRACAERVLLPRVRSAGPGTVVLADGFSCRTQIHELDSGGREAIHLAELLAGLPQTGTIH
jgi:Fe-S oxidoreductase